MIQQPENASVSPPPPANAPPDGEAKTSGGGGGKRISKSGQRSLKTVARDEGITVRGRLATLNDSTSPCSILDVVLVL